MTGEKKRSPRSGCRTCHFLWDSQWFKTVPVPAAELSVEQETHVTLFLTLIGGGNHHLSQSLTQTCTGVTVTQRHTSATIRLTHSLARSAARESELCPNVIIILSSDRLISATAADGTETTGILGRRAREGEREGEEDCRGLMKERKKNGIEGEGTVGGERESASGGWGVHREGAKLKSEQGGSLVSGTKAVNYVFSPGF